jgi:hypothetical protein
MNAVGCAAARERAPELALGTLTGAERAEVVLHVNGCARCRSIVDEFTEIADVLPQLAPEAEPPAGFERRVLAVMRGDRRRTVRRWVSALAATAAAATIVSVALVRIVDAGRDTTQVAAAPALRTVRMIGGGGLSAGRVTLSSGDPAGIVVSVDYAVPDGTYSVELRRHGIDGKPLGNIVIVDGRGEWIGTAALRSRASTTLAMVDSTGNVVCHAAISTASSVAS